MAENSDLKTEVDIALEEDRKESEARSILQDMERLKSVSSDRKRRWIWELLQNAKDCGFKEGTPQQKSVMVSVVLEKAKLIFSHDGLPFTLKQLLALVRRTSTKSYDNSDGNTGKFGTGFVTSHVLNPVVKVSGLLDGKNGLRDFTITIDRTTTDLRTLQEELKKVFDVINDFNVNPNGSFTPGRLTEYEYLLDDDTFELAEKSVSDFIKNLPFTLLINTPDIRLGIGEVRVTVDGTESIYKLADAENIFGNVKFSQLYDSSSDKKEGLLHYQTENMHLAVPVRKSDAGWDLLKIGSANKLYKEFPLIGTEEWHIPFLVQDENFLPSEPRDGIRTIKDNEEKIDDTADKNRDALKCYRQNAEKFFIDLNDANVGNLFLLTESGLPCEKTEYTDKIWYQNEIQKPLREFLMQQPLLVTVDGNSIDINESKIPTIFEDDVINTEFYAIASRFYHAEFPEAVNFKEWQKIIHQEIEEWGTDIVCSPKDLVEAIKVTGLENLQLEDDDYSVRWLNRLVEFLHVINSGDLLGGYAIYPNQKGNLMLRHEVRVDPGLTDDIKSVGDRLGLPVFEELLDTKITKNDGVDLYNTKSYFGVINKTLGEFDPADENEAATSAILDLIAMFPDDAQKERNRWYMHIKQLLPESVPDKKSVLDMDELFKNAISAEFASIKYVCWLLDKEENFIDFNEKYFEGNNQSAYEWLNTFFEILYRREEYTNLLRKYAVIPLQNGKFSKLESFIYREDNKHPFDILFKTLYTNFSGKGNASDILIATEITCEKLPWNTSDLLTDPIDNLFVAVDIEKKIAPDGFLNPLFHQLNDWISKNEDERKLVFLHFFKARPELYVKAFGPDVSSMVMAIHKLNKPIEEIEALVNLNVDPIELGILIEASKLVGGSQRLLQAAQEIKQAADDAKWRKEVGDAAENAFKAAIIGSRFDLDNPDRGYDFAVQYPGRDDYYVEVKSTIETKESVKMSTLQGITARDNSNRYALCVILREAVDTIVDEDYFRKKAKFILGIGALVKDKVDGMQLGLQQIGSFNAGEIQTRLDNSNYSVNVSRSAWGTSLTFDEFVRYLQTEHFKIA